MERNPYAPPKARLEDIPAEPLAEAEPASRVRRFVNYLLDSLCCMAISEGIVYGFEFIGIEYALDSVRELIWYTVFDFSVSSIYYIAFEAIAGVTVGKLATGTRVVTTSGEAPSFKQVIGRTFARLIPFEALTFLRKAPRGWHDSLSGTRVIRT